MGTGGIFKSHLVMWEFIIYIFLPPSLLSFSQWRMWLHFLCLFLGVYKPESWTFSLYKASSSHSFSLGPACNKFTPGDIYPTAENGGERNCQREFQCRESAAEAAPPTEQACLTYSHCANHEDQLLLSLQIVHVSESSHFLFIKTVHFSSVHAVRDLISFFWSHRQGQSHSAVVFESSLFSTDMEKIFAGSWWSAANANYAVSLPC